MPCGTRVIWSLRALIFIFAIFDLLQSTAATVCNGEFNLYAGYTYNVTSPNYPDYYPPYSQSVCKFNAPRGYNIRATCSIDLDKDPSGCSTETFYISQDGDIKFRGAEKLCGYGTVIRDSPFRSIAFGHSSAGSRGKFICTLKVQSQPCDCGWSINTRIANGVEAAVNEFPSMVFFKDIASNIDLYCSGTIISYRYILTAAHCIPMQPNPQYIQAWVGRHNITSSTDTQYAAAYSISNIIVHPDYVSETTSNDIALMRTTKDIAFSRGVGPICLPAFSNINNKFTYEDVEVIGWGVTKFGGKPSATLQKTSLSVIANEQCLETYKTIDESQLCTYDYNGDHRDSCQSDSGGPVIFRRSSPRQLLVGIISYGMACGIKKYAYAVNTRVTSYLNWIHQNTARSICVKDVPTNLT